MKYKNKPPVHASSVISSKPTRAVELTANQKLGDVSVTYASMSSCPSTCPFIEGGCYALNGMLWLGVTRHLNSNKETDPIKIARSEAKDIADLTANRLLRIHVLGDSRTRKGTKILAKAISDYRKRSPHKVKPWGYTHAWRHVDREDWGEDASILASCETVKDVNLARARGYATALVVDKFKSKAAYEVDGIKVIPCPAQTNKDVKCATCRLCTKDDFLKERKLTIAFEAHGPGANKIKNKLELAVIS